MMSHEDSKSHGRLTARLAQELEAAYKAQEAYVLHDHRGDDEQDHGQIGEIVSWLREAQSRGDALSQLDVAVIRQENNEPKALVLMEIEETGDRPKTILGDAFATLLGDRITFKGKPLKTDSETILLLLVRNDPPHEDRLKFLQDRIASCRTETGSGIASIGEVVVAGFEDYDGLKTAACETIDSVLSRPHAARAPSTSHPEDAAGAGLRLEAEFTRALWGTIEAARKYRYVPTYFMQMLEECGGTETARRLLAKREPQPGLFELYYLGILHESMEAVIFDNPRFHPLFRAHEIDEARRRLEELDYFKGRNRAS